MKLLNLKLLLVIVILCFKACGGQPNCLSCTTPGKCSSCAQGYALSLDTTKCNGKPSESQS